MGNKDNMKRKTTRKRHFRGRSYEDAESSQPNLGIGLPEVNRRGPNSATAKKLKLDDVLEQADETNMSQENCFLLFNFSVIQQIIHLIRACQICSSKVEVEIDHASKKGFAQLLIFKCVVCPWETSFYTSNQIQRAGKMGPKQWRGGRGAPPGKLEDGGAEGAQRFEGAPNAQKLGSH